MARRRRIGIVVAGLFAVGNFAGGVLAAVQGEFLHAAAHAALMALGAYVAWRLASIGYRPSGFEIVDARQLSDSLTHLERSVDAIALEVERLGEGQRFITRLFAENANLHRSSDGGTGPIDRR